MCEIKVEIRKCFLRFDFYGALILYSGIVGFFIYQICTESSIITIEKGAENLLFNELLLGILLMTNGLGLTGILLAILCWRTLGKELDQKSIVMYILHARSKWKVFFAKFLTLLLAFIIIIVVAIFVSFLIYFFTAPANLEFITSTDAIKQFCSVLLLIISSSAISILLACVLSMKFGTLGVLGSTIGLSIFSAIFQSNKVLKDILPINLIHLDETTFIYNFSILSAYALVLLIVLKFLTTHKELSN